MILYILLSLCGQQKVNVITINYSCRRIIWEPSSTFFKIREIYKYLKILPIDFLFKHRCSLEIKVLCKLLHLSKLFEM